MQCAKETNRELELRFSIASILCTTGTLAVLLTYLKFFRPEEFLMGLTIVGSVTCVGFVCVLWNRRAYEIALWSMLGAMTAYLCSVGEPLTHRSFHYAWQLVGAATAAIAVSLERYSLLARMTMGAALAVLILVAFSAVASNHGVMNTWMEVACGPLAGAIMVGVVWVIEKLRTWRNYSRAVLIFLLTTGVIGGNIFGRWVGLL